MKARHRQALHSLWIFASEQWSARRTYRGISRGSAGFLTPVTYRLRCPSGPDNNSSRPAVGAVAVASPGRSSDRAHRIWCRRTWLPPAPGYKRAPTVRQGLPRCNHLPGPAGHPSPVSTAESPVFGSAHRALVADSPNKRKSKRSVLPLRRVCGRPRISLQRTSTTTSATLYMGTAPGR
jgi:hypothetical protein